MSYDALHLALMRGFLWLGVVFAVAVVLMCLLAAIAWLNHKWQSRDHRRQH